MPYKWCLSSFVREQYTAWWEENNCCLIWRNKVNLSMLSIICSLKRRSDEIRDYNPFMMCSQQLSPWFWPFVRETTLPSHIFKYHTFLLCHDIKTGFEKFKIHKTNKVCYKLKTCIVQTINSAYKGIFVFYTDKVSVYTVDMKRIINWISETQTQLGDVTTDTGVGLVDSVTCTIPPCGIKKDVIQKSLFTKKSLCLSMANTWPWFFLLLWQGEVRVKVMFLWAEVELAACVPVDWQLHF